MKIKTEIFVKRPGVAIVAQYAGLISLVLGGGLLGIAFSSVAGRDGPGMMAIGFGLIVGSPIWFAVGRALIFLAQIAHNTRRQP